MTVLAVAFVLRVSNLPFHLTRPINSDAALFLAEARAERAGTGRLDPLWPPLYPLAAATLAGDSGDLELAALTLTLLAGTLCPVPVFVAGRLLLGTRPACFAALGTAILFPMVFWSCQAYSETLFILCLYATLLAFLLAVRRDSPAALAGCGLLAGAGYLLRPEGFLYGPLLVAVLLLDACRSTRVRVIRAGALAAGFLVLAAPYMLRLHAELGHWAVSGKAGWNLLIGDRVLGADYDRLAWSLTPDGKALASERAMRELSLGGLVAERPVELFRRYAVNVVALLRQLADSAGMLVSGLALVGLLSAVRTPAILLPLLLAMAPLVALPLFFVNERFLLFALPALLLLAAHGVESAAARLVPETAARPLLWVLLVVLSLMSHLQTSAGIAFATPETLPVRAGDEFREVGRWMRAHCPPGTRTTNVWAAFYAGLEPVQLPLGDFPRLLAYLCSRRCDYLVVSRRHGAKGWLPESSPAFAFLLETETPPEPLREIHRWRGRPEHEVRVFEIACPQAVESGGETDSPSPRAP